MSSSRVLTGLMKSVVQLIEAGICSTMMTVVVALCFLRQAGELLARFPSDGGQDVDCTCFEHSRFPPHGGVRMQRWWAMLAAMTSSRGGSAPVITWRVRFR